MKEIVILFGDKESKNKFLEVAKNENSKFDSAGFWVWSINPNDVAGVSAKVLGHDGIKDSKYYSFIGKLKSLANEYYDFELRYIDEMVNKFKASDKAELLVVHGLSLDLIKEVTNKYHAKSLLVTTRESSKEFKYSVDQTIYSDSIFFISYLTLYMNLLGRNDGF